MTSHKLKDFSDFLQARQKLRSNPPELRQHLRISLMGWSNLDLLAQVIETLFAVNGVRAEVQVAPYNSWEAEVLRPDSPLKKADLCLFLLQPLSTLSADTDIDLEISRRQSLLQKWSAESLSQNYLMDELTAPDWWPRAAWPRATPPRRKSEDEPHQLKNFQIIPIQKRAQSKGFENFFDARGWYQSKTFFQPDALVGIAEEVFQQWKPRSLTKALAIDLDHTLWGGILSEDGLAGLTVGGHDPVGEFYWDFQVYLRDLKQSGIVLALVSKNDLTAVAEAFQNLNMPLKLSDFASIKASWNKKHLAIQEISQELNISVDQFLFLDDDAYEIQEALHFLPRLQTVHLSSDLSERISQVRREIHWDFESQTPEDLSRTEKYLENQAREQSATKFSSFEDFLKDLQIQVHLKPFREPDLQRIHQLFQKTNQFNQKTQRLDIEILKKILQPNSKVQGYTYQVQDRFGDLGLVGAILVESQSTTLIVQDWVMSCRALNRKVEEQVLRQLQHLHPETRRIELKMIPTEKNHVFKKAIHQLNFIVDEKDHHYFREGLNARI